MRIEEDYSSDSSDYNSTSEHEQESQPQSTLGDSNFHVIDQEDDDDYDYEQLNELQQAVHARDSDKVHKLIKEGYDINTEEEEHDNALFIAVHEGHKDMVSLLLDLGANINAKNSRQYPVLLVAIFEDKTEIANMLIERGVDIQEGTEEGFTPFYFACALNRMEIFEKLVKAGAYTYEQKSEAETCLYAAAHGDHLKVANRLIELGANVNYLSARKCTPLGAAAEAGQLQIMELLLAKGAQIEANREITPLIRAISRSQSDAALFLITKGANVEVVDENGNSALMMAIAQGTNDLVMSLLAKGASVDYCSPQDHRSPLFFACMHGRREIIPLLLEKGAKIEETDEYGISPFQAAAGSNLPTTFDVCSLLLRSGSNVHHADNDGDTALDYCIDNGDPKVIKLIYGSGGRSGDMQNIFRNVMSSAHNGEAKLRAILEAGIKPDIADQEGFYPLHLAASTSPTFVKILLDHLAEVDQECHGGLTPLHMAARNGDMKSTELLLAAGASETIRRSNELALKNPTDPQNTALASALKLAVLSRNLALVKRLISAGISVNAVKQPEAVTALHTACAQGDKEMFDCLIEGGANIDSVTRDGKSMLHLCCESPSPNMDTDRLIIFKKCLEKGLNVDQKDNAGATPLFYAAQYGCLQITKEIIKLKGDVNVALTSEINIKLPAGITALQIACRNRHVEIVETLLAAGAAPNTKDSQGNSPLSVAISIKDGWIISLLKQHKATA
eukprot:TRINITY_DN9084_c0_g1_i1.p1 TRINITY_DN9084_c0_g1~~TRINITY_DN9084_c0_g1_i1.p1  ORF type:complete len:733 (+),score=233.59 TRINITY_DN9084_c0_g1_i1:143-2341(+)